MIKIKSKKDLARLRRLALSAQGLLQAQPYGRGKRGALRAIQHIGYVQIDTISVVERAHHHVIHVRVPGFKPAFVNELLLGRDIFEYWAHAAAFLPIADFRFSLPYKNAIKQGQVHWYRNPDKKLMGEILQRVRAEGPIRSRDLENPKKKSGGWWEWKPAKKALEQLYMEGDLMVSDREGFQKTYDLTERVLPSHVDCTVPDLREFASHLLAQQLRCHGLVTLKGLTYLRRNSALRRVMKELLDEALANKELELLQLSEGETYYLQAGAFEARQARGSHRLRILSPFDNCLIQRERLKALFHFDYQLECYLPAAKRKYGYFCLPLLFQDVFVGRMDCKVHRSSRQLEIKSLYLEKKDLDEEILLSSLLEAIREFCSFQGCDSVSLVNVSPKRFQAGLRKAFKGLNQALLD